MPKYDAPKKKKKGFFGRWRDESKQFLKDAEDSVTGFPTGVVALAHALDQAMPRSPIPGIDDKHDQSFGPIKQIGKGMLDSTYQSVRHPLRSPFETFMTALMVAPVVGAPSKAATSVRAAKAASEGRLAAGIKAARRPATRKMRLADKPLKGKTLKYGKPGERPVSVQRRELGKEVEMPANPLALARGLRKITLDPYYNRSLRIANEDALKGIETRGGNYARRQSRRTEDQRARYAENLSEANRPSAPVEIPDNPGRNLTRAPMDLMRLSMYLRPRYYLQNLGGTSQLMAHGGVTLGDVKAVRQIAKNDPELYRLMIGAGGETGTKSISMGTSGGGKLGRTAQKAADIANRPEAHMRTVGVWKAARDFGVTDAAELKAILKRPDSDEAFLIMERANEMLVDYGRIGGSGTIGGIESKFVQSGLPIFYPMMKGFTRYASRFPTQHPVQTGLISALGQQGKDIQREGFGGETQPWFPYITPLDDKKTLNLQNIYTFSPGADIYRQAAQALPGAQRHETLNLLQGFGPLAELVTGAASGRQLATGFEYDTDELDRLGSAGTALFDTLKSVTPGVEYLGAAPGLEFLQRRSAAYGDPSLQNSLLLALLGPGLVKRETDFSKVRQPKKKRPGRKRAKGKF